MNGLTFSPDRGSLLLRHRGEATFSWDFSRVERYLEFDRRLDGARRRIHDNPDDADALLVFGEWLAFRGVWDQALPFLTRARERGAAVPPILIAQCQWRSGKVGLARDELAKALAVRTGNQANDGAQKDYLRLLLRRLGEMDSTAPSASGPNSASSEGAAPAH
jgi:hypothetical protein